MACAAHLIAGVESCCPACQPPHSTNDHWSCRKCLSKKPRSDYAAWAATQKKPAKGKTCLQFVLRKSLIRRRTASPHVGTHRCGDRALRAPAASGSRLRRQPATRRRRARAHEVILAPELLHKQQESASIAHRAPEHLAIEPQSSSSEEYFQHTG